MTPFPFHRSALASLLLLGCGGFFVGCSFQNLDYLSEEQGVELTSDGDDVMGSGSSAGDGSGGVSSGENRDGEGGGSSTSVGDGDSSGGTGGSDGGNTTQAGGSSGDGGAPAAGGTNSESGGGSGDACDEIMCSSVHVMSSSCSDGICSSMCESGYGSCNADSENDGCETDLTRSENCGACDHHCSEHGVSSARCSDAVCNPICFSEYADCNEDTGATDDDGCETHLNGLSTCGKTCGGVTECSPEQVCENGACVGGTGLGVMVIPFTEAGQRQRYGYLFPEPSDLSGGSFILRLHATGAAVRLDVYASDASGDSNPSASQSFDLTGVSGWTDIQVEVVPQGAFDVSNVKQITWAFSSLDASSYQTTTFALDRIWSTRLSVDDSFDSELSGLHSSNYVVVSGSSLYWSNNLP